MIFGSKDYLAALLLCLTGMLLMSTSAAGQTAGRDVPHRYAKLILTEGQAKHPSFHHAAGGILHYIPRGPEFRYRLQAYGLAAETNYTLLYLPEPYPGQGLLCLGSATSDATGRFHMHGAPDLNSNLPVSGGKYHQHGARIVLVMSEDVDCGNHLMLGWDPGRYLFGHRPIHYHDTTIISVDYSGTYCMVMERDGSITSGEIVVSQSGSTLTVTAEGVSVSGELSGQSVTLIGTTPEGTPFTIVLQFAVDGNGFTGTMTTDSELTTLTGNRDVCTDYEYPPGEPQCIQPVADTSLVVGVQQFHTVFGGIVHTGIDFRFADTQPAILVPCDGVVTEINRTYNTGGDIMYHITITYNDEWRTFLAFEPYSYDPDISDQQAELLAVSINQVVHRGELLGYLLAPVPSVTTQTLHWEVDQNLDPYVEACPYNFLDPAGQAKLDTLFASFSITPVCLDLP